MSFFNKERLLLVWKVVEKNRLLRYGAPFILLVFGGSFYLKQFTSLRYEYSRVVRNIKPEELEELKALKKTDVTLESEYDKIKQMDLDSWTNKRGPRPWEE